QAMTNALRIHAHTAGKHLSQSQISVPSSEFESSADAAPYASTLLRAVQLASNIGIRQRYPLITCGQLWSTYPKVFNIQVGIPSISSAWPEAVPMPGWVEKIMQLCAVDKEDAALKEISLVATRTKSSLEFARLSAELGRIDLQRLPDVVLISLLRSTFSIRSHLVYWNSLLEQAEEILRSRQREP
ncbi:hypothetical protein Q9L58_010947, partial [Maublancomyces gigas]